MYATPEKLTSSLPLDDPELARIVELWAGTLSAKLEELRDAVNANDAERVADLAHWLKGSGGTAGYAIFTGPASEIEALARQNQIEDAEPAIDAVQRLADAVYAGLADHKASAQFN